MQTMNNNHSILSRFYMKSYTINSAVTTMMRFFIRLTKFLHTHKEAVDKLDLRMVGNGIHRQISNKN